MSFISQAAADAAFAASAWDVQIDFIEKLENVIMHPDNVMKPTDVKRIVHVLSHYLEDENKNVVQRSLKVIEALSLTYDIMTLSAVDVVPQLSKSWGDQRANIRQQTTRTVSAITKRSGIEPFMSSVIRLNSNGRGEVLHWLKSMKLTPADCESALPFILSCLGDKSGLVRNLAMSLARNEEIFALINNKYDSLTTEYKKNLEGIVDRKPVIEEIVVKKKTETVRTPGVYINTSAFSRKSRQNAMNDQDGVNILGDVAAFVQFSKQLALDIHDVFDDQLAEMLTSNLSSERMQAIDGLRNIFDSDPVNFQNSVDVTLRWCGVQFIGRNAVLAEAALSLLASQLDDDVKIASVEAAFIVPVLLWCSVTQHRAYMSVFRDIMKCCSGPDLANALLISMQLNHSSVTKVAFEQLGKINDFTGLENKVRGLMNHPISYVREGAKTVFFRSATKSPRKRVQHDDPVSHLKTCIQKIREAPECITDPSSIFSMLLDQFEAVPTDTSHIRYLLYATHSFLTEPLLVRTTTQKDLITLVFLMCEFSLHARPEFADVLNAIGFNIVTAVPQQPLFEALMSFLDDHIDDLDKQSFPYQVFTIGVTLLSVSCGPVNLDELRSFAKSVIGRGSLTKDDLRALLCRSLLSEIVLLEQHQRLTVSENSETQEEPEPVPLPLPPPSPKPEKPQKSQKSQKSHSKQTQLPVPTKRLLHTQPQPPAQIHDDSEKMLLFNILKKLTKNQTRAEGISELIKFDESADEDVISVITKLIPGMKRDIDDAQKLKSTKRRSNSHKI